MHFSGLISYDFGSNGEIICRSTKRAISYLGLMLPKPTPDRTSIRSNSRVSPRRQAQFSPINVFCASSRTLSPP